MKNKAFSKIKYTVQSNEHKLKRILYFLPIIVVVSFVPIYMRLTPVHLSNVYFENWTGDTVSFDFFTFKRSILFMVTSFAVIILSIMYVIENKTPIKHTIMLIPIMLYGLLMLLSVLFASFRYVALLGFVERYEGGLIIFCYLILLISTNIMADGEFSLKSLLYPLIASSILIAFIGLLQFFGYNLLTFVNFQKLVVPNKLYEVISSSLDISNKGIVNSTLYNPNNVGLYTSMLLPLAFGIYLSSQKKMRVLLSALYVCLLFSLCIGSRSRAGLIASAIAILVLLFYFPKSWVHNKKRLLIVIPLLLIFVGMDFYAENSLLDKFLTIIPAYERNKYEDRSVTIDDIVFDKHSVTIITDIGSLVINYDDENGSYYFSDADNSVLAVYKRDSEFHFLDGRFDECHYTELFNKDGITKLSLTMKRTETTWIISNNGIFLMGPRFQLFSSIDDIPSFGFSNNQNFGSGRGYIWSKSLPMLKDTLFIGHGPDTFVLYYPQNDIIGKLNQFLSINIIVDKPHNFYIQTAHNTGVLSLIALLSFFVGYLIQSFRLYSKIEENSFIISAGKIISCSVLGYLIAAIFVDSVIYVAPVFWVMTGAGLSVNNIVKNKVGGGITSEKK